MTDHPSQRVAIAAELAPILDALYELPTWWTGAAIAMPDWPEGDFRWKLWDDLGANTTAQKALDDLRRAINEDRKEIVRRHAEAGVPRPQLARALHMSLGELREWIGWP